MKRILATYATMANSTAEVAQAVAEEIARQCGRDLTIEYRPLPQDDPTQRRPDITRAQTLLAWQPAVDLRDGLARTIPYFAERLRRPRGKRRPTDDLVPFVERRRAYTEVGDWTDRLEA